MQRFSYNVLSNFRSEHYKNIIGLEHVEEEIVVDDVQLVHLQKNKKKFLLPLSKVDQLPLRVRSTEKINYKGKVWHRIKSADTVKKLAVKTMSFRTLVNTFCDYKHNSPTQFLLLKIIGLASEASRVNVRISSNPAFGKDSVIKVMGGLTDDAEIINNPTLAKLEYLLYNKVLALNEISALNKEERRDMAHFLQATGDLSNTYVKRSRAGQGTSEEYDISKVSLLIFYNHLKHQVDSSEFFDNLFGDAVKNRFIPFYFEGNLDTRQFIQDDSPERVARENTEFFKDLIHNIQYYRKNWYEELHNYELDETKFSMPARHWSTFYALTKFVDLYSENQEEFDKLVNFLYECNRKYYKQEETANNPFAEFEPKIEEEEVLG